MHIESWKKKFLILWMINLFSGLIIAWFDISSLFFRVSIQFYLSAFVFFNTWHLIKKWHENEKKRKFNVFLNKNINEVILILVFLYITLFFPKIMRFATDTSLKNQFYFHIWDSLTVHILCWIIYTIVAKSNNMKKGRSISSEEWKNLFIQLKSNENAKIKDIKRKMFHFLAPLALLISYYALKPLSPLISINENYFIAIIKYIWFIVSLHFLWVMNIADLLRLHKFNELGRFATRWYENSLREDELETFASGSYLIITWLPFITLDLNVYFLIVAISTISDAMASIVGKHIPLKIIKTNGKSLAGFIGGAVTTYLLTLFSFFAFPSPNLSFLEINLFALICSINFFLIDFFSLRISDNFLNSIIIGMIGIIFFQIV